MAVRTSESGEGLFRRRYQLVASLDGREVETIIRQLVDFVPDFRAWKHRRGAKAKEVIFAIVAPAVIHRDLREALQRLCRDADFTASFQSLAIEFAVMDEHGWLRDKLAFVRVDAGLETICHFDGQDWFGPFTEQLKK